MTTARRRLIPGEPGEGGYGRLVPADGEQHRIRRDLSGVSLRPGWQRSAGQLLCIAHMSDTHVMDHQLPGRAELFDRFSDLDSALRSAVGMIGCYRAQELFTLQVADAMARAVRRTASGPISGAPADFAIVTGDATDNCQLNELTACHTHVHAVRAVREDGVPGGFWQITTASHIDWPQQARMIEVLEADGAIAVCCTVIDSDAPAAPAGFAGIDEPAGLAALARELAANDWQVRDAITAEGGAGAGTADDRNVILLVDWPRP